MTASITFNTLKDDAKYGKITGVYSDDVGVGSVVSGFWKITDPFGNTIKTLPSTPDVTFASGTSNLSFTICDIPTDADGNWLTGLYTITFKTTHASTTLMVAKSYEFYPKSIKKLTATQLETQGANVGMAAVCASAKIRLSDNTDYTGWTIASRSFLLTPPTLPGQSAPSGSTHTLALANDKSVDVTFGYTNTKYQSSFTAIITKSSTAATSSPFNSISFLANDTIVAGASLFVDCEGVCDVAACLKAKYDEVTASCRGGEWNNLSPKQIGSMMKSMMSFSVYLAYDKCGDVTNAQLALETAKEACSCGCGCTDTVKSDVPKPYTI
jgi:hypothetical protein